MVMFCLRLIQLVFAYARLCYVRFWSVGQLLNVWEKYMEPNTRLEYKFEVNSERLVPGYQMASPVLN